MCVCVCVCVKESKRERCRACQDLGLSGRVREKEEGREEQNGKYGGFGEMEMAIRAGEEGILMCALVKSGLILKVRVKSVRKNTGW